MSIYAAQEEQGRDLPFGTRGGQAITYNFPTDGEYVVSVRLRRSLYGVIIGLQEREQIEVRIDGARDGDEVTAVFSNGATAGATFDAGVWQFDIAPEADWPAGPVTVTMRVNDEDAEGEGTFFLNQLGAELSTTGAHAPGEPLRLRGRVFQMPDRRGVGAQFRIRVVDANGQPTSAPFGPFTAAEDGTVDETLPASATAAASRQCQCQKGRQRRRCSNTIHRRPPTERAIARTTRRARPMPVASGLTNIRNELKRE